MPYWVQLHVCMLRHALNYLQVRNAGVVWNEARRQLRQDPRWDTTELLELTEKERLFQEHTAGLVERKRLQFRRLLEETSQVRTKLCIIP